MKDSKSKILVLIPLNPDGYVFQWTNGKASQVRERLAADFRGWKPPDVLMNGNHEEIRKFRKHAARQKTERLRPDLVHPYGKIED